MIVSVQVDSRALEAAFRAAPALMTRKTTKWINRTALMAEREAKQELSDNTDTGRLQSSVRTAFGILKAEVKPTAQHAIYVHEGRRPGSRMPPFGERTSLGSWARRKGIEPFVVARAIARKGIEADKYMDKAYRTVKPKAEREASELLNEIVREI